MRSISHCDLCGRAAYLWTFADPLCTRFKKKKTDTENGIEGPIEGEGDSWLAVYDILTSKHSYSESIYDLEGVSEIMAKVAKINHLPDQHSRESLLLLRQAWCDVDLYHDQATRYKVIAKICYLTMLFFGIFVVVVGVVKANQIIPGFTLSEWFSNYLVLGASLGGTIVAGIISYMNPSWRWQQLRSHALQLESDIWAFRTRSGIYKDDSRTDVFESEEVFQNSLTRIRSAVHSSADLQKTCFYAQHSRNVYNHDQFPSMTEAKLRSCIKRCCRPKVHTCPDDNFYSLLKPEEYIDCRVKTAILFYKKRIPKYAFIRGIAQVYILFGSLSGAILAFLGRAYLVGVISIINSAVVAWMEFQGVDKKMERYSTAINDLETLKIWWFALQDVEKFAIENIDKLIESTESIIQKERDGWRATSDATTKQLAKAAQEQSNNNQTSTSAPSSKREEMKVPV